MTLKMTKLLLLGAKIGRKTLAGNELVKDLLKEEVGETYCL